MPCEDVLDSVWREGSIPECISLEIMEGSGNGNLVGGYRVGVHGGVDELVSDDS